MRLKRHVIFLMILSITLYPFAVPAQVQAASGARHEKVGDDVFLGGNFIEVGIAGIGSFGTASPAPAGFHPMGGRTAIGFNVDADGYDTGSPMNSGDYFLPGGPYEAFIVGYRSGSETGAINKFMNADRMGLSQIPSVTTDISSGDTLAARTIGTTSDGKIQVEQTVSFGVNDKYFKVSVQLKNVSDETVYDVRYMRSVDPDIDMDMNGTYNTLNSVSQNPPNDSSAIVISKGPITGNALILMSADPNARASVGYGNDPYAATSYDLDGSQLLQPESSEDTWIGLTGALGNLAPDQSKTFNFYDSLNPDIDEAIDNISNEAAPVPAAPTGLAASAGDGQAHLSWNSVTGATYYEIYQGTAPGEYGESALATVSESTYNFTATGLANGTTYYFTVKAANDSGSSAYSNEVSATPQVAAPVSPVGLTAIGGNGQANLSWNSVTGATYYEIYQGTAPGEYGESALATVSGSTYSCTATGLANGTTYYFTVKAGNDGGSSGYSNEVSATPKTVPAAPADIIAAAGDGQATITFTAPADNGGSAVTGYEVTSSPDNIIATGTASPITITGLQNGTAYTFTVKAINSAGSSAASAVSNAVTPLAPFSGNAGSIPVNPQPTNTGVNAIVNGKVQTIGTATTAKVNDQTVTTIVIDPKKLEDALAAEDQHAVITIPVNTKADVVIGELNGQMVKNMEQKQAVLEIKTENATYTLPAQQINISHLSDQLGKQVALQDIKVQIEIAAPKADTLKTVENAASKGQFTIVAPPINFSVRGIYGDAKVEVSKFNAYVERTLAIPDGIDPQKITTGVVIEPDGAVRHVPTKIVNVDGKYFAEVNSLTNSTYSVVWHPLEFKDVAKHWAKDAVNDMGSRMIVTGSGSDMFNPDQDITRAEFAAIIVRGLGLKPEGKAAPFSDVQQSDWYNDFIQTAYAYHLITGFEDGTFRPDDKITREQAMAIIAKAMTITDLKAKLPSKEAGEVLRPFADANKTSGWAKNSAADCLQAGIISGRNSSQLAPKDNITRAEVAAIIQRLLQKSDLIN
ncbi:S-layer homology domain-containing protein [Paenibacillus durus]|uniref:S-layer homology domain-containing protein n=1 Tax=Paenibacillus durus TaxID=44251 RepID=UPI000694FF37|nr:S-layer homology domain-containing protein [Paenibacillus durus]